MGAFIGSQFAQQSKAVQARHHDIGQYQVRRCGQRGLQRRRSVGNGCDFITFSQQATHVITHISVVIRPQNTQAGSVRGFSTLEWIRVVGCVDRLTRGY